MNLSDTAGVIDGVAIRSAGEPPRAAILSVGTEILLGDLTDTNATWISQRLKEHGVEVIHHVAVGDELDRMVTILHWLAERVHIIVVGGGLGPTADDLTREAIAAAAGVELLRRADLEEQIAQRFVAMGRRMAPQNLKQARMPAGATAYPPVGTAPAFGMTLSQPSATRVYALPGVGWEMRELFSAHVEPELLALCGERVTITRVLHVAGRGESDVAEVVEPMLDHRDDVVLAFLAKSHEIQVRLTVSAADRRAALETSQPLVDALITALDGAVVGVDDVSLEGVLVAMLSERNFTIATAESATAGDLSARLARIPGASKVLAGGHVVYSDAAKLRVGGISPEVLERHGAVSEEVTAALAVAAREQFDATFGVAVTGVAGPGPHKGVAAGTCYWAVAMPDGSVEVAGRQIPGERSQIQLRLGTTALDLLRQRITQFG